ncbi:hypothetical protein AURANDRAFT_69025, partial [Aureococcus anophagefferens]
AKSRRGGRYGALMYQSGRSTHVLQADARQLEWFHFEAAFNWQTHMLDLSANGSFWRLPFSAYPLSSVYIRNVRGAGTSSAASDFGDIEVDYCRMSDQWDKFNELGEVLPYSCSLQKGREEKQQKPPSSRSEKQKQKQQTGKLQKQTSSLSAEQESHQLPPRRNEDYILVRKYEPAPRTATPTDGAPAPAKLNLGNKTVWLPTADIEDIIVVAHATEHIGVPLNGLKDVYVIDRVSGRTVPAGKWAARPEDGEHGRLMGRPTLLLSRTSKVLRWRFCLRSQVYALLSGDAVSSVAADKTGIGYATKKLAIDVMDWDIIKRLVGCADDGGAALTRCVESSGESKKWSLRPDDVMNVRRGASTTIQTINLTSDAQLEDVTGALGSLWNVGVKASLLDGSESTEVGFEDPERADDADETIPFSVVSDESEAAMAIMPLFFLSVSLGLLRPLFSFDAWAPGTGPVGGGHAEFGIFQVYMAFHIMHVRNT